MRLRTRSQVHALTTEGGMNTDGFRCFHHPAAPLADNGDCRACIRLGYGAEIRAYKAGRGWVHTIRFATDEEIATREPCCGEDLGTHAEWCEKRPERAPAIAVDHSRSIPAHAALATPPAV